MVLVESMILLLSGNDRGQDFWPLVFSIPFSSIKLSTDDEKQKDE